MSCDGNAARAAIRLGYWTNGQGWPAGRLGTIGAVVSSHSAGNGERSNQRSNRHPHLVTKISRYERVPILACTACRDGEHLDCLGCADADHYGEWCECACFAGWIMLSGPGELDGAGFPSFGYSDNWRTEIT